MTSTSFRSVSEKNENYTKVDNLMINDKDLTLQAKGLLMILLSNSDDWAVHMKNIIARSKNGRDAHYKIINELIDKGYFARITISNGETHTFEKIEYLFSDVKSEVAGAINQMKTWAVENNKILDIEYEGIKEVKKPDAVIQDTDTPNPVNDYSYIQETETPDTVNKDSYFQETETPDTENQDNKKNNLEKTKNKKTNIKNNNQSNLENQINSLDIAKPIQIVLKNKMDRLISDGINLNDILLSWETQKHSKDGLNEYQYADMLQTALTHAKGKIGSRSSVSNFLKAAILTYKKGPSPLPQEEKKKTIRTEMPPSWFDKEYNSNKHNKTAEETKDLERKKKEIAETLAQLRRDRAIKQKVSV